MLPPEKHHALHTNGFTLVEIIVVMVIIALSMSLFLGLNFKFRDNLRIQASARKIRSFLLAARSQAQLQARTNSCLYLAQKHLIRQSLGQTPLALPPGMQITANSTQEGGDIPLVLFFPDGGAAGSTFLLTDRQANRIRIHIDPLLGEVSIGDGQ